MVSLSERQNMGLFVQTWQHRELVHCISKLPVIVQRMGASDNTVCLTINTKVLHFCLSISSGSEEQLLVRCQISSQLEWKFSQSDFIHLNQVEALKKNRAFGRLLFCWRRADYFLQKAWIRSEAVLQRRVENCETNLCDFPIRLYSREFLGASAVIILRSCGHFHEASVRLFHPPPTLSAPRTASPELDGDLYRANSHELPMSSSQVSSQLAC